MILGFGEIYLNDDFGIKGVLVSFSISDQNYKFNK